MSNRDYLKKNQSAVFKIDNILPGRAAGNAIPSHEKTFAPKINVIIATTLQNFCPCKLYLYITHAAMLKIFQAINTDSNMPEDVRLLIKTNHFFGIDKSCSKKLPRA